MDTRNNFLAAVFVATTLVLLAGCTGMNGGEAAMQAAPVPPPPGESAGTVQKGKEDVKPQGEDLPDRLFAPLDDSVDDINRDINREIDREVPPNEKNTTPDSSN
jgi:hypothetical protein